MFSAFLTATAIATLFLMHCVVVGGAVLRGLCRQTGPADARDSLLQADPGSMALYLFYSICLGMLVNMAALFALGIAGQLHGPGVGISGLLLFASGAMALRPWNIDGRGLTARPPSIVLRLECAALVVIFLLCIAVSLHPPGHWDDTMYQLPLARHYVEQQAITLHEFLRFPLFPQNFNLLFSLGMMIGDALPATFGGAKPPVELAGVVQVSSVPGDAALGTGPTVWRFGAPEILAQVFATLPLFVMALGVWGASRRYLGSGTPGLLAGLTLFMISPVKSTLGFAYIDNGLALFCTAAALVAAEMAECLSRTSGQQLEGAAVSAGKTTAVALQTGSGVLQSPITWRAVLAGLVAGAACGTKYFGVVFAAWLGAVMVISTVILRWHLNQSVAVGLSDSHPSATLASMENSRQSSARPFVTAAQVALLYAFGVLLAGSAWYVRSYVVSGDPAHPAGAPIFGFFLWNEGDLAFQYSEQAVHGVGGNPLKLPAALHEAGVLLWISAFAGLFLRRVPAAIRVLQAAFVGYMLFWFFVSQVPRYLGPVYGLGGFLTFYTLHRVWWWVGAASRGNPSALRFPNAALLIFVAATAYATERGIKYGKEFVHAEDVLRTNPGYSLYQHANAHVTELGDRLVQVGFENGIYFFQGTVVGDWFGPGRYRDILECERLPCPLPDPEKLAATLKRHDARMVLLKREQVSDLNEAALLDQGWRILASDTTGLLLTPETE